MKLSNKAYDNLKTILTKVVPALIFLIGTLGEIYHFEDIANTINLTIGAIATAVGMVLGISSKNYYKNKGE